MLKLVNYILNEMKKENKKVEMILLTGSRLNNLHSEDSDYDLYIVTESNLDELLNNGSRYSVSKKFGVFENSEVEGKVMSLVKFLEVVKKTNFNTLELFTVQPLYLSDESLKLYRLFTKPYRIAMCNENIERMIGSISGYAKQNLKRMDKNKNKYKDTVQCIKGYKYLKQISEYHYIKYNDMSELKSIKYNASKKITENDLIKMNKYVIYQCEKLSEELKNKHSTLIDELLLEMMNDKRGK